MSTHCKICGKEIKSKWSFTDKTPLCIKCFHEFKVLDEVFLLDKFKVRVLYYYEDFMRNLIYLFKALGDYELKDVFLYYFLVELKIEYRGYYIVPAPSNLEDDLKRGYNHVEEIFTCLNLPFLHLLKKNKYFKQSSRNKKEREEVKNDISLTSNESLEGKKILLVDDIFTTGSTLKVCYDLISQLHPKKIKVLTLSKKINNDRED